MLLNLSLISFTLASKCDSPEQTPQDPMDAATRPVALGIAWMIARYLAQATQSAVSDVCEATHITPPRVWEVCTEAVKSVPHNEMMPSADVTAIDL